jgi:hypothetical protein
MLELCDLKNCNKRRINYSMGRFFLTCDKMRTYSFPTALGEERAEGPEENTGCPKAFD